MKYIYHAIYLAALISFFLLQSCNEQPTALGFSMLYDTTSVKSVVSGDSVPLIVKTENVPVKLVIFNSSCVFIGKAEDMSAVTMLRFQNIPDSLASLPLSAITECYMEIYPNRYAYGDTASNLLSFNLYKITKYWTAKTNCDSLFNSDGTSDFFDTQSQGYYSDAIPYADSGKAIKIDLNKQLLLDWFTMARDSVINWGIVLKPESNSNVIRQFSAQAIGEELNHPTITMKYKDANDSTRTLTINTAIDASVVCKTNVDSENMILQGVVAYKPKITFDLSRIPSESGVLYSELVLTLNKTAVKKGNLILDSLIAGGIYETANLDTNPTSTFYANRISGTDKFVFSGINSVIEGFIRNGGKGSIVLYPYGWSLVQRLDLLPFYGMNEPNVNLRPKLKVVYSTRFRR